MADPSWTDRLEQALGPLNLLVLLIPVVAVAMQLSSAAADFVTATANPADVAELETPPVVREPAEPEPTESSASPPTPAPAPASTPAQPRPRPSAAFGAGDSRLGYGL